MSMTMQTLSLKEHEGVVHNPIDQWSSPPWWNCGGSERVFGESVDKFMPSVEHSINGGRVTASKGLQGTDNALEKGNASRFIIFPGENISLAKGEKPPEIQAAITTHAAPHGHVELGFGQPTTGAAYLYGNECYGALSTFGPPVKGRMMLPLSLTKDDGPIYVNPKQYHGIIRRRLSRAKEESRKTILKARKPYLHLSRHLHAMRRQRGCGGRFVNTKKSNSDKGGNMMMEKIGSLKLSLPTESHQNSEFLQVDNRNAISSKERKSNNLSGSEATGMFLRREFDPFSINTIHSQGRNGMIMPGMWVAAADNTGRCNPNA